MKTIAILTLVTAMLGGCVVVPWGHGRSDGYYRGDGYRGDRYYRSDRYYHDDYRGYSYRDRGG